MTSQPSGRRRAWSGDESCERACAAKFACDDNGVASFTLVRYRHHDEKIFLYAFDLIELNGDDLR
jgi:hypothetical protein